MSDMEEKINAVWAEHHVVPTGADMSNECRLAAVIISLREKIARAAFRVESNENGSVTIADEQGRARRVLLRGERWEA